MLTLLIVWLLINVLVIVLLAGFGTTLKRQPLDGQQIGAAPPRRAGMKLLRPSGKRHRAA